MNWTPAETFGLVALIVLGLLLLRAIGGRLDGIHKRLAVLSRVEAKLDLLLMQANTKFDPLPTSQPKSSRRCGGIKKLKR
jgi:hypothetical protein